MKKTVLIFTICVVALISIIAIVLLWINMDRRVVSIDGRVGAVIEQKETALVIGRALLYEYFPNSFPGQNRVLNAEERNGIWRVYEVIDRVRVIDDDLTMVVSGGLIYVEFRKSNGQVLRIGTFE